MEKSIKKSVKSSVKTDKIFDKENFVILLRKVLSNSPKEALSILKKELKNYPDENGNYVANFVFETTNLSQFEKIKCNRKLMKKHAQLMSKEAVERGIIVPIVITEEKKVFDGQHRLEGSRLAQENGLDIHPLPFIITPNSNVEQIKTINTKVKKWVVGDYLSYGVGSPNKDVSIEYQKYAEYFKEFGGLFKHNELRMICLGYDAWNANVTKIFESESEFKIVRTEEQIRKIYDSVFEWGQLKKCNFQGERHFQRALLVFLSDKNYDNKQMIELLNSKEGHDTRVNLLNKNLTYTSGQYFLPMKEIWNNNFPKKMITVREPKKT